MNLSKLLLAVFILTILSEQAISQDAEKIKPLKEFQLEAKLEAGMTQAFDYDEVLVEMESLISPSVTLGFSSKLNQRFSLQLGLMLQNYRLNAKDYTITFGSDIDLTTGIDQYGSWFLHKGRGYAVGVPLGLTFQFTKSKSYPYASVRLKTLFSLRIEQSTSTLFESGMEYNANENNGFFSAIMTNPGATLGYSIAATDDLNVFLEGFFDYCPQSTKANMLTGPAFRFMVYGVGAGVRF
jgi:hypothetical protein